MYTIGKEVIDDGDLEMVFGTRDPSFDIAIMPYRF